MLFPINSNRIHMLIISLCSVKRLNCWRTCYCILCLVKRSIYIQNLDSKISRQELISHLLYTYLDVFNISPDQCFKWPASVTVSQCHSASTLWFACMYHWCVLLTAFFTIMPRYWWQNIINVELVMHIYCKHCLYLFVIEIKYRSCNTFNCYNFVAYLYVQRALNSI